MEIRTPHFSFLIVNFRSRERLSECLSSVRRTVPAEDREIIVINNDPEPLDLPATDILIINSSRNEGFGKAVNAGARKASGEILFLINPDATLKSFPAEEIFRKFSSPNIGVRGGRIIGPDGRTEPWSNGKEITLGRIIRSNLPGLRQTLSADRNEAEVDWVSGGALLIRRDIFRELGGFDEQFFLYFEDMDLARRVRERGRKVLFFPEIIVRHAGGESFSSREEQKGLFFRSQEIYLAKHRGPSEAALARILRKIFHP